MRCRVGPIRAANAGPPAEDVAKKCGRRSLSQISEPANPRASQRAAKSTCQPPQTLVGPHTAAPCLSHPTFCSDNESCSDARPGVGWDQFAQRTQAHQRKTWPKHASGKASRKPASRRIPAPASASPNQLAGCPKRWWARTRLRRVCPTLRSPRKRILLRRATRCRVGPIRAANAGPPAERVAGKRITHLNN
jgi:hypothetical protein